MKIIKIFDTTLRDGEQSPGAHFSCKDKVRVALQLEKLGVDIIEAGFAIASPEDAKAIAAISKKVKKIIICSLSRAVEKDIDAAAKVLKEAKKPRIHIFIGTSPQHVKYILKKDQKTVYKMAVKAVKYARQYVRDVAFSPMDASRTDIKYLACVVQGAIDAGAKTINVTDTVGYSIPSEWNSFLHQLVRRCPRLVKDVVMSVHCHNDLGLATANALAALEVGARQVECTINGLGERGGNTSLEETVMAIKMRSKIFNVRTRINTKEIYKTSRMVAETSGLEVQRNKAIVGANAFAHESGIHQDGVLKHRETFEIMCAQDVGWNKDQIVLGKLSGRHALKHRLESLGVKIKSDEHLQKLYQEFIKIADKKGQVSDQDLKRLKVKNL